MGGETRWSEEVDGGESHGGTLGGLRGLSLPAGLVESGGKGTAPRKAARPGGESVTGMERRNRGNEAIAEADGDGRCGWDGEEKRGSRGGERKTEERERGRGRERDGEWKSERERKRRRERRPCCLRLPSLPAGSFAAARYAQSPAGQRGLGIWRGRSGRPDPGSSPDSAKLPRRFFSPRNDAQSPPGRG